MTAEILSFDRLSQKSSQPKLIAWRASNTARFSSEGLITKVLNESTKGSQQTTRPVRQYGPFLFADFSFAGLEARISPTKWEEKRHKCAAPESTLFLFLLLYLTVDVKR